MWLKGIYNPLIHIIPIKHITSVEVFIYRCLFIARVCATGEREHTMDWDECRIVDIETTVGATVIRFKTHEDCVATACNVTRDSMSTEGMQQRRRRVMAVVDVDAVEAAVRARLDLKAEKV